MVKQTKKGSIGKKALSAILAASMIMTSSSFVMAGPVVEEVENVATAAVVEEVDASEENVGDKLEAADIEAIKTAVTSANSVYTGEAVEPIGDTLDINQKTLKKGVDYTVAYKNNVEATPANADDSQKASVTISFIGGTYGENESITVPFSIAPLTLTSTAGKVGSTKITYGNVNAFVYNGTEQHTDLAKVEVTVKLAEGTTPAKVIELTPDNYELAPTGHTENLIDAGTKTWNLTGKGNFTGSVGLKEYNIEKAELTDSDVTISTKQIAYNNKLTADDVKKAMTIKNKAGDPLNVGEFTVEFQDAKGVWGATPDANVGVHNLRIVPASGNKNFEKGSATGTYEIVKSKTLAMFVNDAKVKGFEDETAVYDGTDKCPVNADGKIVVEDMGGLVAGTDYEITTAASEWKNVGEYTINFKGLNAYEGETATITVKVTPKALNASATEEAKGITADVSFGTTHSGNPSAVVVTVKDGDVELESGKDFTYTTTIEKAADGKNYAYAVITGIGNYTTTLEDGKITTLTTDKAQQSEKLSLQDVSISASVKTAYQYDGQAKTPAAVTDIEVIESDSVAYTLTADDYYVSKYENNTKAGTAKVFITGKGKYEGTREIEFEIVGTPITDVISLDTTGITSLNYTGSNLYSKVVDANQRLATGFGKVVFKATNASYSSYTVEVYKDGSDKPTKDITEMGTYKLVIKSTEGKYSGTLEASFQVVGSTIEGATIAAIPDQAWTGKAIEPAVTVTVKTSTGTKELVAGKDYTVTYVNNVKVGMAYLTVEGIGDYSGQIISSFNIVGEMDQPIEVLPAQEKALQNRTLNDKATKVKYTTAPETAVTYTSSDANVVTVDAEGNIKYTGLGEATITIKAAAENDYKETIKELKVVVGLKQPTFTPSSRDNAFTVTTSTVKGAEKFEVQYVPTGKSFNNAAAKTKTFTVDNKLKKGKVSAANKETYRVRVRAINGDHKTKWSPVKTIATL